MASLSFTAFSLSSKPSSCSVRMSKRSPRQLQSAAAGTAAPSPSGGSGGAKYKGTHMRETKLAEMIEKKVIEAKEICGEDETSDECKVAWDEVEEVSQAKADLRLKLQKKQDPLEFFCQDHPETDECAIPDEEEEED
ncbi:unnamed protein product [Cuscuta campestris]|uniref:CP12 domain-containing protein n=2 Tax=Cuscuta sect. Cleistogrammica TaxID=1824901 RepID=A0A484MTX1_9ASTE|nr:hypothetical protein DM860_003826 [Cuscuta australis]VFQ92412.1 unnamed protein product [Cuscuta campestris]